MLTRVAAAHPSTYPHTCKLACVQQPSTQLTTTTTTTTTSSLISSHRILPHLISSQSHTTTNPNNAVCIAHLLKSTALCYSLSVSRASQALSMMRNGKRSDCNALLVSLVVASALPVLKSCPSSCPRPRPSSSCRAPLYSRFAVVELDGHQYTIPLIGAQPSTAPMRPGQRLRVNNLPPARPLLMHYSLFTLLNPPPAGATPRSRRRTQGDDYFKTEKI